jgi:hypothetical protein
VTYLDQIFANEDPTTTPFGENVTPVHFDIDFKQTLQIDEKVMNLQVYVTEFT